MKTRLLIVAMSTALLAGCVYPHPNCAPLQQAEKRNSKDLDAYCYTEATQDTLKCAKAKDERDYLREQRASVEAHIRRGNGLDSFYDCHVTY